LRLHRQKKTGNNVSIKEDPDSQQAQWLYLHFPLLPLESLPPMAEDQAAAVICSQKNWHQVICCNSQAHAWGIEPSLSLSTALALCPDLITLPREIESELQSLQRLAVLAYSFSPIVIVDKESSQGLWLDLTGCSQLFQGYDSLLKKLQLQLHYQGVTACSGIAQSPLAAQLLCRKYFQTQLPSSSALETIALSKLALSNKQQQNFNQLGLQTLADLQALPKASLSRRFGVSLIQTIALLTGEKPCTLERFRPPTVFHDLIQNPQGIYSKESLLFPMKVLLQRLCQYLLARQCYCREIHWEFQPLMGSPQTLQIKLSGSQNNWSSLLTLCRLQLERLELPRSVEQIILHSDQFVDAPMTNSDLFGDLYSPDKDHALIDSLNARLGIDALSQPVLSAEPLPEQAGTIKSLGNQASSKHLTHIKRAPQPLWLLTEPAPVQERNKQLYWRQPLTIISGPERLCGNWWQSEQQRDYYLACDSKGARYWLFRQTYNGRWFVHGLFA
jgi:protein ImuB